MQTYHEWDADGKHYRAVIDEDYTVDKCCGSSTPGKHEGDEKGSYCSKDRPGGGDGEEECERWFLDEIQKLDSGEWVALGVIVSEPCAGIDGENGTPQAHCECCSGRKETGSLWGIVVEASEKAIEELVKGEGL